MGNNFSRICGETLALDKVNEAEFDDKLPTVLKTKANESVKEYSLEKKIKATKIQSAFRQFLLREKYNNIISVQNQKEFEENLESLGKEVTEEEMNLKLSEKVISVEETISNFNPTKKELKKFKNSFERGPIQFEDGSIYKGSWHSLRMRKGYGILINSQGFKYEGFWINEKLNGRGRFIDDKGNYYEGEWRDGMANGSGDILTPHVKYVGSWKDDLQDGYGEELFVDGDYYKGHFKNGVKHGVGKFFWKDGSSYEGEFVNSTISGKGSFKWSDGRSYEGDWENNKMHGTGTYIWPEGKKYVGQYRKEKKEGFGTYFFSEDKYYEGEWLDNKQHGFGIYYIFGNTYKVQFRFGKLINKVLENKIDNLGKCPTMENDANMIVTPPPQNEANNGNLHIDSTPQFDMANHADNSHLVNKERAN